MPWILWNQIDADPHLGHHGKLDFDRCYGMRLTQIPTENHRLRQRATSLPECYGVREHAAESGFGIFDLCALGPTGPHTALQI